MANGRLGRFGRWRPARSARAGALGVALIAAGCATSPDESAHLVRYEQTETLPEESAEPKASPLESPDPTKPETPDTFETVNRPVFGVNEDFDDYALGPVARGWKRIAPAQVRRSISNFYRNITFPQRFVGSLGQGEMRMAGVELSRLVINSTLGIGGLFDPSSKLGLGKYDEDLGRMLARWGLPSGPYIVIPFAGPSTPRDTTGDVLTLALNPLLWLGVNTLPIAIPLGVVFAINGRAGADRQIEAAKEASLDYYVFVRDAYIQRRARTEYVTLDETSQDDLYLLYDVSDEGPTPAATTIPCDPNRTRKVSTGPEAPGGC